MDQKQTKSVPNARNVENVRNLFRSCQAVRRLPILPPRPRRRSAADEAAASPLPQLGRRCGHCRGRSCVFNNCNHRNIEAFTQRPKIFRCRNYHCCRKFRSTCRDPRRSATNCRLFLENRHRNVKRYHNYNFNFCNRIC